MSVSDPAPNGFLRWAAVADAVAATRSKTAKVGEVAAYLAGLDSDSAALAARFFSGRIFASWDGRTLGVGGASLSRVLGVLSGLDGPALSALWARHGDAGATMRDVVVEYGGNPPGDGATLGDVDSAFAAMAAVSSPKRREELLLNLVRRCSSAEAAYLAALIGGELRIGLREGLVEEAITVAFAVERGAVERANMMTGDLGEVARLAAEQRLDVAAPRLFAPLRFMLAGAASDADAVIGRLGEDVWVEDKYDGVRCQIHVSGEEIMLFSRDLKDITAQFPDIARGGWPETAILDGEILAFRDSRVLPFFALQRRLGRKNPSASLIDEIPVVYVAWDVLYTDHGSCLEMPLRQRRELLETMKLPGHVVLSHREQIHGAAALDEQFLAARARLNEGLMVKNPDSLYQPGRRGYHWLKLKRPLDTLDVVVVGAEYGHGKRHGVLSDVTFAVRDEQVGDLVPIGKAYTGLTDVEIAEMTDLIHQLSTAMNGRYHSVTPSIVLEVAFDSVQRSARHRSGYALRFPRIVRWRRDKSVADIDTLERVSAIEQARAAEFTQRVDSASGQGTLSGGPPPSG